MNFTMFYEVGDPFRALRLLDAPSHSLHSHLVFVSLNQSLKIDQQPASEHSNR